MSNIYKILAEIKPSIRWKMSSLVSKQIYSKAFLKFGKGSVILSPLRLKGVERMALGNNVIVLEGAWLDTETSGKITIEDNVYVGYKSHLHAVDSIYIGQDTIIGMNVTMSNGSHDLTDYNQITSTGAITVGKNCFIGERAFILGGVTIGDNCRIGACAVVTKDVPSGTTVAGVPARPLSR